MPGGECLICKVIGYCEIHHIILRSQASYMKNIKVNLVQLCMDHHRGSSNGVHHNKKLDLKLKVHLQNKLMDMFSVKQFYSIEEIQTILKCSTDDVAKICKKLTCYSKGYLVSQIIIRLMGGRLYQ